MRRNTFAEAVRELGTLQLMITILSDRIDKVLARDTMRCG